jgi:hypothetical protein
MRYLFVFFVVSFSFNSLCQYPDWVPSELRNKVFCGDLKTSGKDLYGNSTYITIPYEIYVTEDGVQMRMNPREQFGEDKWGETIKVRYEYGTIQEDERDYQKRIKLDLSSKNESSDSPVYPDYELVSVQFNVCTYKDGMTLSRDELRRFKMYKNNRPLPSNIACCIKVPYYTSTCGSGRDNYVGRNVCRKIKTKKDILKEQTDLKQIESLLNAKKTKEAASYYKLNDVDNNQIKYKIIDNLKSLVNSEKSEVTGKSSITDFIQDSENKKILKEVFNVPGVYDIDFDQDGNSINYDGLKLALEDIPKARLYDFWVPINSNIKIEITKKTKILSETYSMGKKAFKKYSYFDPNTEQFLTFRKGFNSPNKRDYAYLSTGEKYIAEQREKGMNVQRKKLNENYPKTRIVRFTELIESFYANDILINAENTNKSVSYDL